MASAAVDDLATLSRIVGAPVAHAERGAWGFENRTDIVTLVDGRRLVVQRIARRLFAPRRAALARTLPPLLRAAGIPAPLLHAADPHHDPPFVVREFLPGRAANTLLDTAEGAAALGRAMGALLPRVAAIDPQPAPLPDAWASPETLAGDMRPRLLAAAGLLDDDARAVVADVIDVLPRLFDGRPAVLAHGDYCPVNALVLEGRETEDRGPEASGPSSLVLGLIDFDEARLADPLFDAAWWGWVVRHHHPEQWRVAWPHLLAATPAAAPAWAERLSAATRWR